MTITFLAEKRAQTAAMTQAISVPVYLFRKILCKTFWKVANCMNMYRREER
jgi:hypothetical protein